MKTVLLVDDDPRFLSALADALHQYGYATVTAHDGDEALTMIASQRTLDAAIVDLAMPTVGASK